jgi:hypothetical protein
MPMRGAIAIIRLMTAVPTSPAVIAAIHSMVFLP